MAPSLYYNLIQIMDEQLLLNKITDQYLSSRDFNGFPIRSISLPEHQAASYVRNLVLSRHITLNFGDRHPNPHVKAFKPEPVDIQLAKLDNAADIMHVCAYPSQTHLATVVNPANYAGRPFSLEMALGAPSLDYVVFDLTVLEAYRNDPRYHYSTDDIQGDIAYSDAYFDQETMDDYLFLQTFGFAYDDEYNRAVGVFFRYLANMDAANQQIWRAKKLDGEFWLHPDYWRTSMGHWPERVSVFEAFIAELKVINEMSVLMGRPPLFRHDFQDAKPREFGFLIRPTLKEFNSFVQLLDKLLSDNIGLDFFRGEVALEEDKPRSDGRVEVIRKNTIRVLDEWIDCRIKLHDPGPKNNMITAFRKVRSLRNKPSHSVKEDEFDQRYFHEQRELVLEVYTGLRTLRLMLSNHPATKSCNVPDWLYKGEIWSY